MMLTVVLADVGIGPISIPTPGDLVTALKNAVVDVADAMFDKIIEWISGLLADAVAKVTEALVFLLKEIRPTLTPGGAIADALPIQQSVMGLAASLLVAFYLFRIIHGLITGQAGSNMRATLVDLPMVVVGTLFFGFLCYTLLSIIDAFSDPMIDGYATTLNETVTTLYSKEGLVKGGLFVLLFAILYLAAAIFLCFELFVRSSLIYLVVMFAPLAIATRVWGPTRNYARKATETAVALIFSKLAIAVTLATGASLMKAGSGAAEYAKMIQGSAIVLLAAFMPFALMRVIPMMEGAVAADGVARGMGTKAAIAGYGASRAADAISSPVSSTSAAIKSKWDNRSSGSSSSSESSESSGGSGGSAGSGSSGDTGATGPSGGGGGGGGSSPGGTSPGGGKPNASGNSGPSGSSPTTRGANATESADDPQGASRATSPSSATTGKGGEPGESSANQASQQSSGQPARTTPLSGEAGARSTRSGTPSRSLSSPPTESEPTVATQSASPQPTRTRPVVPAPLARTSPPKKLEGNS